MSDDREDLESYLPPQRDVPPPPPPPPPLPPADYFDEPGGYPPRKRKAKRGEPLTWQDVWLRALTRPRVDTFEEILQDPLASTNRAYMWVFIAALAGSVLQSIANALGRSPLQDTSVELSALGLVICAPIGAALGVLFFALFAAIQNFIARLLGGSGTYEETLYANAAFYAPLALVGALVGLMPELWCISLLLALYGLVLNTRALRAVHQFEEGQAWLTVFAPVLVIGGCLLLLVITLLLPVVS